MNGLEKFLLFVALPVVFFSSLAEAFFLSRRERYDWKAMGVSVCDLAGRTTDLINEVDSADLVVMVATAGESACAAAIIGEACSVKRVNTTGLIIGGPGTTDEALSKTLAQLRPWSLMLVIASAEDYIEDMLVALRA